MHHDWHVLVLENGVHHVPAHLAIDNDMHLAAHLAILTVVVASMTSTILVLVGLSKMMMVIVGRHVLLVLVDVTNH